MHSTDFLSTAISKCMKSFATENTAGLRGADALSVNSVATHPYEKRCKAHLTKIGGAALILFVMTSVHAQEPSVACGLLQATELESALGGKAAKLSGGSVGNTDICNGQVGSLKVLIRIANGQTGDFTSHAA